MRTDTPLKDQIHHALTKERLDYLLSERRKHTDSPLPDGAYPLWTAANLSGEAELDDYVDNHLSLDVEKHKVKEQ